MASRSIDDLHPQLAHAYGVAIGMWTLNYPSDPTPILTATYRSPKEQDLLYAQPFDKKDNGMDGLIDEPDEFVTNAKGGESPHNYLPALAFDVAFVARNNKLDWSTRLFDQFATLMKRTPNITWGGDFKSFKDRPHFELTDWKSRIPKQKVGEQIPGMRNPPPPPPRPVPDKPKPRT